MINFRQREGLNSKIKAAALTQRKIGNETPPNKKAGPLIGPAFLLFTQQAHLS